MPNNVPVEKGAEVGPDQCEDQQFEGWEKYPTNFEGSTAVDFSAYHVRIAALSPTLFCEYSEETEIQVIDLARKHIFWSQNQMLGDNTRTIAPSSATCTLRFSFLSSHTFEQFILETEMPKTRIMWADPLT